MERLRRHGQWADRRIAQLLQWAHEAEQPAAEAEARLAFEEKALQASGHMCN